MIPSHSTGIYPVGTECFTVPYSHGTDDKTVLRKIEVRMYYPGENILSGMKKKAPVLSPLKYRTLIKNSRGTVISNSDYGAEFYENLPHAAGKKFPLVIFSCGLLSHIEACTYLCIELASHGYIIASVGHPGEMAVNEYGDRTSDLPDRQLISSIYPKGMALTTTARLRMMGKKGTAEELLSDFCAYQKRFHPDIDSVLQKWARDMKAVRKNLRDVYAEWTDFTPGTVAAGHSLGGAAAYYLCQHSEKFSCGINIDGALYGNYDEMIMKKPFLQICCRNTYNAVTRALINKEAPAYLLLFKNMTNAGFTDLKFHNTSKFQTGSLNPELFFTEFTGNILDFLGHHIKKSDAAVLPHDSDICTLTVY